MLAGMSLSKKLTLLISVALIALIAVAAVGIVSLRNNVMQTDEISKVRLPSVLGLDIISSGQTAMRSENRLVGLMLAQGLEIKSLASVIEKKKTLWESIDTGWKLYEPLPKTAEEAVLWKRFVDQWAAWKKAETDINTQILKLAEAASDEARAQSKADFVAAAYAAVPFFNQSEATLREIVDLNVRLAEDADLSAETNGTNATRMMSGISLVACVVLALLGTAIARSIFNTIGGEPELAKTVVERIAAGDLTQSMAVRAGDDSSLIAYQQKMQTNLQGIVRDISSSVSNTELAADGLATAAHQVAAASADTADSASSMAASVEELSVSIGQVSENAAMALRIAEQTGERSINGGEVIDRAVGEINRIAETVRQTAEKMGALSENSNQISSVVQVIKDVADQTNLLALNAAIEAARAGEAGRGFAVVADEVRKLAERTTTATVEIGNMITRIQSDTVSSVATMESAVTQVDRGVSLASEAGAAISEIRDGVNQVVNTVNDIVNSIQEQSVASQQIAQQVERVAQASEENNAAARQTADSAGILKGLAGQLKRATSQFRIS
ncbi:MAG: methyl-accepting chemotaxis protein [Azonexus sp.]|nr:methyl-accepting chemotaxis protein [Azonexus sp.]